MNNFINLLATYAYPIFATLSQVAVCVVAAIIGVYIWKTYKKTNIELSENDINSIENITIKVIKYLNQTIVNKLKEESNTGKLTDEQIEYIQETAIDLIVKFMGSDLFESLTLKFGDEYIEYLQILIESAVVDAKNDINTLSIKTAEIIPCNELTVDSESK